MAKQSGIHQIRGKVGEMSYYQQSGVNAGIVRRINQGLSSRVKTAPEFANTRLNNAEFKTAALIGAAASHSVIPAWRSMFRRFAQANMVKRIQEAIKQDTTNPWGLRQPQENMGVLAAELLENYAKAGQYQGQYGQVTFTPSYENDTLESIEVSFVLSESGVETFRQQGITGFNLYYVGAGMFTTIQDDVVRVAAGHSEASLDHNLFSDTGDWEAQETVYVSPQGIGFSPRGFQELLESDNGGVWMVVSIVPFRTIGGVDYEMQEMSTYVCGGFDIGQEA